MRLRSAAVIVVAALAVAAAAWRARVFRIQPVPNGPDGEQHAPASAIPLAEEPPSVWVHPADEVPEMRLELLRGGEARLTGGLTFYNPARWTYDASAGELLLRLSGVDADTRMVFEDGVRRGAALRYQPADSVLVLRWRPGVERLWLAGYYFLGPTHTNVQ